MEKNIWQERRERCRCLRDLLILLEVCDESNAMTRSIFSLLKLAVKRADRNFACILTRYQSEDEKYFASVACSSRGRVRPPKNRSPQGYARRVLPMPCVRASGDFFHVWAFVKEVACGQGRSRDGYAAAMKNCVSLHW